MIKVTKNYIDLAREEVNNYNHHYTITNLSRKLDLTELLLNDTLSIHRFLRTANGFISPSTLDIKLQAKADKPAKALIKDFYRKYKEFGGKKWKDLIFEENLDEYLVKIGDKIIVKDIFNGEELTLFYGKATSVVKLDTDNSRTIKVKVDDNTIKGYEYVFSEDISFENYYIYNSKDKEKSLLFILCRDYLEYDVDKLDISDIKDTSGTHIRVPLAVFKKGTKIMQELSQLVKSFYGNIYTMPNGDLRINSLFDKSYIEKLDLTFGDKEGNYPILEFIETTDVEPKENKVEVKYSNIVTDEIQEIFSLSGQNATKDDAKILVRKNTQGEDFWKIEFNDVVELNKTPIVKAYKVEGSNQVELSYTSFILEWINDRTARVKFNNPNNYDIFIKKFAFKGKPITKFNENSIFYTEETSLKENETNLKSLNFKYAVSKEQAIDLAKLTYYNESRPYSKIKLRANNMPFLELEDVIGLDYKKFNGKFQIIAITQTNTYSELILKEYREYQAYNKFVVSEKSSLSGGIKSMSQIKKEEKEAEDRLKAMENGIKKLSDELKQTVSTTLDSVTSKLRTLETKVNDKYNELNNKINDLNRKIEDSYISEQVQKLLKGDDLIWTSEKRYLARILNQAYDVGLAENLGSIDDIYSNSTAMDKLFNNSTAMDKLFNNSTAMDKLFNNSTAMDKLFNNSTAMDKLFNNSTLRNNFRKHNYGETFKNFIINKNGTATIIKYHDFLWLLYSKKKRMVGASKSFLGNSLLLDISIQNSSGYAGSGWKGPFHTEVQSWANKYKDSTFTFLKDYQTYTVYLKNDTESNDWVDYYDLDDPIL